MNHTHTHSITCTYYNFFFTSTVCHLFHGVLFSSATWITISWHIRAKYAQLYRIEMWDCEWEWETWHIRCGKLMACCATCARVLCMWMKERRWDCVAFLQHNHRPNEMQCNRVFEGQHVISPIYCICYTFSCHAHFNLPKIYVVFNTYQYTISTLCASHVRTIPF